MAKKFLTPIGLPSGTSNPTSAQEGELFYRSDENSIYIFDGAIWKPQADTTAITNTLVEYGLLNGDAGDPESSAFTATVSGGSPSDNTFVTTYEGGEPDSTF